MRAALREGKLAELPRDITELVAELVPDRTLYYLTWEGQLRSLPLYGEGAEARVGGTREERMWTAPQRDSYLQPAGGGRYCLAERIITPTDMTKSRHSWHGLTLPGTAAVLANTYGWKAQMVDGEEPVVYSYFGLWVLEDYANAPRPKIIWDKQGDVAGKKILGVQGRHGEFLAMLTRGRVFRIYGSATGIAREAGGIEVPSGMPIILGARYTDSPEVCVLTYERCILLYDWRCQTAVSVSTRRWLEPPVHQLYMTGGTGFRYGTLAEESFCLTRTTKADECSVPGTGRPLWQIDWRVPVLQEMSWRIPKEADANERWGRMEGMLLLRNY